MIIKIVYVAFFGLANLMLYIKLNKSKEIGAGLWWASLLVFLLFILIHLNFFAFRALLKWDDFFPLVTLFVAPVVVYYWYTYFVIKRINALKGPSESFLRSVLKVFSFLFLKAIYLIIFIVQCVFIFEPLSTLNS